MSRLIVMELGAHEVKLIESDANRLTKHAAVLLHDAGFIDGMPTSALTAGIRSAMELTGCTAEAARVAIPDIDVAIRDFPLPAIPAKDLPRAVMFEARRLVPMHPTDVYYAWHATSTSFGHAVYLVAARRNMIDAIALAVSAAGLRLERMDLKPLALARGAGAYDGLVLEWGSAEATLVLVVKGRPRFFRTLLLDAPPEDPEAQLDELALSFDALLKFIRSAEPDVTIGPTTPLFISGRFALVDKGTERARQRFDFAVQQPVPPAGCPPGFPWQAHVASLGLLRTRAWRSRLTPLEGGDIRAAA